MNQLQARAIAGQSQVAEYLGQRASCIPKVGVWRGRGHMTHVRGREQRMVGHHYGQDPSGHGQGLWRKSLRAVGTLAGVDWTK